MEMIQESVNLKMKYPVEEHREVFFGRERDEQTCGGLWNNIRKYNIHVLGT